MSLNIFDTVHKSDPIGFWENGNFKPKTVVEYLNLSKEDVSKISQVRKNSVRFDDRIPQPIYDHLLEIANICLMVAEILDNDVDKTKIWLNTSNPALGGISPKLMIRFGRYKKLLEFILNAKENLPHDKTEEKEQAH